MKLIFGGRQVQRRPQIIVAAGHLGPPLKLVLNGAQVSLAGRQDHLVDLARLHLDRVEPGILLAGMPGQIIKVVEVEALDQAAAKIDAAHGVSDLV